MKLYLLDIFNRFKNCSIFKKIIFTLIFLIQVFILVICFVKVDYEITTPGSLNNPVSSITIENANDRGYIASIGIFSYKKVSLIQYWLSKNKKTFDVSEINEDYYINLKDETTQGKIMKDNSLTLALINAYREASKVDSSITINLADVYVGESVIAIYSFSDTNLEYGDIIIEAQGIKFNSQSELRGIIQKELQDNHNIHFKVLRGENEVDCYSNAITRESTRSYGFAIDSCYNLPTTTPTYTLTKNYSTIGPSGGLLSTLAIYNMLLEEDVTKGYKITGTGTINFDGTSGAIGGIEQKIVTAKLYGVDIFFVDSYDYSDALKFYQEHECTFELVNVYEFTDIINYLDNLEAKEGN